MDIYYKNDSHKEQTSYVLRKLGLSSIEEDLYYGSFAYIVGATWNKADEISKALSDHNINHEMIYETIERFSSSEKRMIRFALQCFNDSADDIKLSDVMQVTDSENSSVIKQAIMIRY